jgi:sulfate/thiosulfate transport system substrate-binding protein
MKRQLRIGILVSLAVLLSLISLLSATPRHAEGEVTLTLGAYSVPREAYAKIITLFQKAWQDKTGVKVNFKESYLGSGAQARAVVGGFEADVVALSLEQDITKIVDAKLITRDWKNGPYKGIVSTSIAVVAVRKGNPKNVMDWADLAKPGIEVLTPDPSTSGGAQWNVLAVYGAAKRGKVSGYDATDEGALRFLGDVFKNVSVMDKDARESFLNFEHGVGDAAITYENEVFAGLAAGGDYDMIYPTSTILIENPAAVVDVYADKHGVRDVADAFVQFLATPEAQRVFAENGFRPVVPEIAKEESIAKQFPEVKDLFTIQDFGGWTKAGKDFFGEDGLYTKLIAEIKGK